MGATGFTLDMSGFQASLRQERDAVDQAAAGALYGEAQEIMTRSKEFFAPVESGALRASGFVDEPEIASDGLVEVQLSYGGAAFAYALYQHERLDLHHPVGQAKYLETPFNEAQAGMTERLSDEVGRRLGRG